MRGNNELAQIPVGWRAQRLMLSHNTESAEASRHRANSIEVYRWQRPMEFGEDFSSNNVSHIRPYRRSPSHLQKHAQILSVDGAEQLCFVVPPQQRCGAVKHHRN